MTKSNSHWIATPLKEVLVYLDERVEIDDMKEYITITVKRRHGGLEPRERLYGQQIKTKKQFRLTPGAFIISRVQCWHQAYAIVPDNLLPNMIASTNYDQFAISQKVDQRFFWWLSHSPLFNETVRNSASGVVIEKMVFDRETWLEKTIPLPSLEEQRRIVAKIDELAAKAEEALTLRQQTTEKTDALLDFAVGATFTRLNQAKHEALGALTTKIGSGSTPLGGRANYPSSGVPFIRSLNVRMRQFKWEGITFIDRETHERMNGTQVRPNDVLLNITGASIGRVACAPANLIEANVNQHVSIIRPVSELDSRYLMHWLSQPSIQEFINNEQKGATRQGFTKAQIERFHVPVLPIFEQKRIVAELDSLQARVDALRRIQAETNTELEALLPSILDKAFKGEL